MDGCVLLPDPIWGENTQGLDQRSKISNSSDMLGARLYVNFHCF